MPYVTTRLKPRKKEIDLLDFLNDLVTVDMLRPPTKYQTTGTRTYYYDSISLEKLTELNIPKQIEILEKLYKKYQHLDINNGHPDYNYELQVDLIRKYKRAGLDKDAAKHEAAKEMATMGLKYSHMYDTFFIPKASSEPGHKKWRRIDAPCDELKDCLSHMKLAFEILMDGCYYHTAAFAYINNRSTKDAVMKHANNKSNWFLKIDFSNFFGSTSLEYVMRMFSDIYPFSEIMRSSRGKRAVKNCLNLCFLNGGLPQGTPMSPILTNIMMIPIDHHLSNALKSNKIFAENECGFVYTRYADDIMISNRFKFNHHEIVDYIKKVLAHYDAPFSLNDSKTRYGSNAGSNWMLGLMLNQSHTPTVGHKRKKQLKAILSNYMLDRNKGCMWSKEDVQHLQGEISYCKSIEPETIEHIIDEYSRKFGDIRGAIKADIKNGQ